MAKEERSNPILKVEAAGARCSKVTVRNAEGRTRVIRVRQGSMFADRPKPKPRPV